MLDRDTPQELEEEVETDAGGDVVRLQVVVALDVRVVDTQDQGVAGVIVSNRMGFLPPPWTTTIATTGMVHDLVDADGLGLAPLTCRKTPIRCRKPAKMLPHGYLPLSTTCF